ncbi:MAG: choline sulfate utilization transcriptional regulator [Pseudorhizobium sp.]
MRAPVDVGWLRLLVEISRHGSLSAAARKHGVSQPAVSYQIRQLESAFGVPLFVRQHRGVALTSEGQKVLEVVERAVCEIDILAGQFHAQSKRPALRLCTDYAFAALWLIPRMHGFRLLYPDLDIQIVSTQRLEPDWSEAAEIAVAFGTKAQFSHSGRLLMPETVVPVCSQALLERVGDPAALLSTAPLVHLDTTISSPWFDWLSYFDGTGTRYRGASGSGDLSFNTYAMVVQAAVGGQGVALGWLGLVDTLLASGTLVRAGPELAAQDRGYWVVTSRSPDPNAQRLAEWLLAEARVGV